jgi:hypothetical protein
MSINFFIHLDKYSRLSSISVSNDGLFGSYNVWDTFFSKLRYVDTFFSVKSLQRPPEPNLVTRRRGQNFPPKRRNKCKSPEDRHLNNDHVETLKNLYKKVFH